MPYSLDLRKCVINAVKEGMTQLDASELFNVNPKTIYNWLKLEESTGSLEPITGFQKGHSHGIIDYNAFKEFVDVHPDYTQEEIAENFSVGSSTVGRTLKKIGYTRKKRRILMKKGAKKSAKNI